MHQHLPRHEENGDAEQSKCTVRRAAAHDLRPFGSEMKKTLKIICGTLPVCGVFVVAFMLRYPPDPLWFCQKAMDAGIEQYQQETRTNVYPNVEGDSTRSFRLMAAYMARPSEVDRIVTDYGLSVSGRTSPFWRGCEPSRATACWHHHILYNRLFTSSNILRANNSWPVLFMWMPSSGTTYLAGSSVIRA